MISFLVHYNISFPQQFQLLVECTGICFESTVFLTYLVLLPFKLEARLERP